MAWLQHTMTVDNGGPNQVKRDKIIVPEDSFLLSLEEGM